MPSTSLDSTYGPLEYLSKIPLPLILVLAAALRVAFFVGTQLGDDLFYLKYAHDFITGDFRLPTTHWEGRVGLVLPVALFSRIFGFSEYTAALFPFACSLINIVLIYKISEILFSPKIGIVSSLLLSVFPLELYYSTSVYPTVPLSTFVGLTVFFLVRDRVKAHNLNYFFSGLFLGLSYLIHATGLFLGLFFLLYFVSVELKRKKIKALCLASGLLLVILAETLTYAIAAGEPMYRFHIMTKRGVGVASSGSAPREVPEYMGGDNFITGTSSKVLRGHNFWLEPLWTLTTQQEFGLYYYVVMPITLILLLKRNKNTSTKIMLIWFIPVILYLFYGTVSPFSYLSLRRWPRYFSIVSFPMIILLSLGLVLLAETRSQIIAFLLVVLLILSSLGIMVIDNRHRYAYVQREVARYISSHDGVYYGKGTYWKLAPFVNYEKTRIRRYGPEIVADLDNEKRAFVVYSEQAKKDITYPTVRVFETPKSLSTKIALKIGLPDVIVQRLWRKETYIIAKID